MGAKKAEAGNDPSFGYGPLVNYSVKEITEMYLKEGENEKNAHLKAKIIQREIRRLNKAEQRLWKKVRKHEDLYGLMVQ